MESKSSTTKYQTLANAEEQHLAALSSMTATKVKKVSKKTAIKSAVRVESVEETFSTMSSFEAMTDTQPQLIEPNENVGKRKLTKKKASAAVATTSSATSTSSSTATSTAYTTAKTTTLVKSEQRAVDEKLLTSAIKTTTTDTAATTTTTTSEISAARAAIGHDDTTPLGVVNESGVGVDNKEVNGKKKLKSKKNKKTDSDKQNISVKSSFSKFDALQKRNLIHVRSSDAGKAQEKFSNPQGEVETKCRLCSKPVYKMEEIKAEKSIFHKNCFRCNECKKQLKLDNFQSHEGVLYCLVHFKLLFAPKFVEDTEPEKPRKPELIIRENQPVELPPDVVRASDKPDLGLEELQQLNVRSRFQVFENGVQQRSDEQSAMRSATNAGNPVKRSSSILSKLAKLQALGFSTDISAKDMAEHGETSGSEDEDASASDNADDDPDNADIDLVRSKKSTQRERPVGLGHAMNDIKTKFEKGHMLSKEERREERKQEIQNIRSRLFMGKQARIKEMYQQAVADSEQAITASDKKPEIEIGGAARSIKERFEKGEMFKDARSDNEDEGGPRTGGIHDEADVFESAISKKSRSIFMELDANVAAGKNLVNTAAAPPKPQLHRNRSTTSNRYNSDNEQENSMGYQQRDSAIDVVKCDEKPEDIKIETSEISSKFKFFETYRPTECQRKEFRITPPREGVVKMPTPDSDGDAPATDDDVTATDGKILEKSQTTAMMLNKFREMEQNKNSGSTDGPRPLKCFTPPPDGGRRVYHDQESDMGSQEEEEEDDEEDDGEEEDYEEEDEHYRRSIHPADDEALQEAKAAARAKQLRAKFEKWEANEVQREMNDGHVDIYSDQVSDNTNIESTKSIRDRFEQMKSTDRKSPTRPRYQVNRFV